MKGKTLAMLGLWSVAILLVGGGCRKAPEAPAAKRGGEVSSTKTATTVPATAPAQGEPIKIGAIFAITGPAANLGEPEAKTAEMCVERLNAAGGISGHKVQLIVKDSGSTPDKAVSLTKQLIEEEKVLAIIGPSTSGEAMAMKGICQEGKTIMISCAAAASIVDPVASYVFKVPQNDSDAARVIYTALKTMGISKIGVLASNDGFGANGAKQLEALKGEYGMTIAASESYDKQATDLTNVLTKLKGQDVQAVVNWSAVPAQSVIAKNMKQIEFNVPLFQSHGFGNIKYVQAGGDAVNGTIFPCGRILIADLLPADHPQKAVLTQYKKDYEGRYKEEVSTFGGHPYDALLLLSEAIKKAGSTDTDKVRDALENLKGVVGTAGVFNFSPTDHCGLTKDAFELLTVTDGKFAIYKK
jgi:branched-chain amino acid transport system substrate-binding protein